MCTIMTYRETLPAEKRSKKNSQKEVDRLINNESSNPDRKIYVWLNSHCFGNSSKTGFYYMQYRNSIYQEWGFLISTAYAHPVLIVQKNKLRADQVEYMERKCRETAEVADQEIGF